MSTIPRSNNSVILRQSPASRQPLPVYHDVVMESRPLPAPSDLKPHEIIVKMGAVSYNHRDVWIRKGQYGGIKMGSVMGADGAGTVVASPNPKDSLLNKRVFLVPMRGWSKHPDAPEGRFGIMGGVSNPDKGTFSEYVVVERDQVIESPEHLNDVEVAAWPLGGVTAWRATIINAQVQSGQNVLITGIGGGVAIIALQLCVAKGANVYVTSGSEEKIKKAKELGARGGVSYKEKDWPVKLSQLLNNTTPKKPYLDAVIDSAGGDLLTQLRRLLKQGGRVVCYGMTATPQIKFTMPTVLANQKLIGSTMGSHADLADATNFISEHKIKPVISHVFDGLDKFEEGFETMRKGDQMGKIVLDLNGKKKEKAKL